MEANNAICSTIECALNKVLLYSLTRATLVGVEGYKTLWQRAVAKTLLDNCTDNSLLIAKVGNDLLQLGIECELLDILKQSIDTLAALILIDKLEELLEHTGSSSRCRDKLCNGNRGVSTLILCSISGCLLRGKHYNTVGRRGCADNLQRWETTTEILNLTLYSLNCKAVSCDLF